MNTHNTTANLHIVLEFKKGIISWKVVRWSKQKVKSDHMKSESESEKEQPPQTPEDLSKMYAIPN